MMNGLGDNLRRMRLAKGKLQREVEAETGISAGHISMLENGKAGPGLETACMLADYYGVSLDTMIGHRPGTKYIK